MGAAVKEKEVDPLDEEFFVQDDRDVVQPVPSRFDVGMRREVKRPVYVGDDVYYAGIYWLYGSAPRGHPKRSEVADPPTSGYSHCFVIDPGDKSKLVTLFCPYTFGAWQVTKDQSYEFYSIYGPFGGFEERVRASHAERLQRIWAEKRRRMEEARYDVAAIVMRAMGLTVPKDEDLEGFEVRQTGGKPVEEGAKLTKPVKRSGRRGEVLAFFLEHEGHRASIHSATAKFGITRSNLLSQLFLLRKEHGIGYKVEGDTAAVELPEGCEDPFA